MPRVLAIALSKSFPPPKTQEPFCVVTRVAVGAPEPAFALFVAPIAPDPFVPAAFTPEKLMTVIDETTLCERVAVTETLLNVDGAKARQISEEPLCALVRTTRTQVRPAPVTPVTVVFEPDR